MLHVKTFVVRVDGAVTYGDLQVRREGVMIRVSRVAPRQGEEAVGVLPVVLQPRVAVGSHPELPEAERKALSEEIENLLESMTPVKKSAPRKA